jgi:hypothetical protein
MKSYENPDPLQNVNTKCCKKCKETKTLAQFGFMNKARLVYRTECRDCRNKICKEEYAKRKEKKQQEPESIHIDNLITCPSCCHSFSK